MTTIMPLPLILAGASALISGISAVSGLIGGIKDLVKPNDQGTGRGRASGGVSKKRGFARRRPPPAFDDEGDDDYNDYEPPAPVQRAPRGRTKPGIGSAIEQGASKLAAFADGVGGDIGGLVLSKGIPIIAKYANNVFNAKGRPKDSNLSNAYNASQAAYGSAEHEQKLAASGYQRDDQFQSPNAKVYHRPSDKHTFVAFRGTADAGDIAPDLSIANGTYDHSAFKDASNLVGGVRQKYQTNINTTGHSLGGTKAIRAADNHGVKAIAFNPGAGLNPLYTGQHTVFHKTEDPISHNVEGDNISYSRGGHGLKEFEGEV